MAVLRETLFLIERVAGAILLAVLAATIFTQVVFRFVLDFPLAWSEEVSRYCFIWLTMVVAPICVRQRANLGLDALLTRLPGRGARAVEVFGLAMTAILAGVLLVWGTIILEVVSFQRSPALGLPMQWIYAAIPVGAGLTLVEIAAALNEKLAGLKATATGDRT